VTLQNKTPVCWKQNHCLMKIQPQRYFKHGLSWALLHLSFSLSLSKHFPQFPVSPSNGNYFPLFLIHNFFVTMWSQLMAKFHKLGDCGDAWRLVGSGDKCIQTCVSWVELAFSENQGGPAGDMACYMLHAGFTCLELQPWRWMQYVPPNCRSTFNGLHSVISQKI
jgi:hypothetical protein